MNFVDCKNGMRGAVAVIFAGALLGFAACGKKDAGPMTMPPAAVTVVTLQPSRVELSMELPGRTSPYRVAEVRPQVGGIVLKRLFTEGAEVKAGDQLYQIDPAPYQAALASAQASLQRAQATEIQMQAQDKREQSLVKGGVVSQQDYDNVVASYRQALADVSTAQASVQSATINLEYTKVTSPITGRTGRSTVTEGALVTTGQTLPLTTVNQLDPIYVDMVQPVTALLRLQREMASGLIQRAGTDAAVVHLSLEDGTPYDLPGQLEFSEVSVDQGTGSVTLRAQFPNPKHILLPGLFVRAQLQEGVKENAILVPQQGVTHDPRGSATALVVGPDNKVELRTLKTERIIGDKWLVSDGLKAGDRVIVEGVMKAMPGVPVVPQEQSAGPAPGASPAASASPAS